MKTEMINISITALDIARISNEQMQAIADGLNPLILPSVRQRIRLGKLQAQAQHLLENQQLAIMGGALQPSANRFGKLMRRKALCYRQFSGRYLQLKAGRA